MITNKYFFLAAFFVLGLSGLAQDFSIYQYRNVGPLRGGRVTAVAGTASEPGTFYLGATGGGVWKTEDYGNSWYNVSDGFFKTPSIGSISVAQNDPNIIYVGTGSDGLRSNVIAGKGVYKSIDAGKTWEYKGLPEAGQIGAVEIHPENHNIAYVAAIGQPFGSNKERGIFKTVDGGSSWKKVLFISEETGFRDIEMLPGNPEILYAAAWKAVRKPWTIISGGENEEGGIYKSINGGDTWQKLEKGLPKGLIGKIDLAVSPADSRILYALVEAPSNEGGVYKSTDQGRSFQLMSNKEGLRTRPFYYTNIEVDPKDPEKVFVMATGYYKSTDGAKNWSRISSPHGDNHDMWINPQNTDLFIQANDGGANVTQNGGKTWSTQFNQPTSEIYQVEVDDQFPYWLYGGQQDNYSTIAVPSNPPNAIQAPKQGWIIDTGGCETGPAVPKPGNPDIVYANCKGRFSVFNKITGTQKAYYVGASNMYGHNPKDLKYRFQRVSPIHISPHDPNVIYHTSQYVHRTTNEGVTWETISPDLTAFEEDKQVISGSPITRDITGEEFYSTIYAIRESALQKGIIWTGANDGPVHVSTNNGETWQEVTPKQVPAGGRVDAVEPSSHRPGKAYVAIHRYQLNDYSPYILRTNDYGESWQLLTGGQNGIPADHPVRVVREHPGQEGLLFAGTDFGIFISKNDGQNWSAFQQNLPVVPITDLKIKDNDLVISTMGRGFWIADDIGTLLQHSVENEKISIYSSSKHVRYRGPRVRTSLNEAPSYERPAVVLDYFLPKDSKGAVSLSIENEEGSTIAYLISDTSKTNSEVLENMQLSDIEIIVDKSLPVSPGLNRYKWDMTHTGPWHKSKRRRYQNGPMVTPGKYKATLKMGDERATIDFELVSDPRMDLTNTSPADLQAQEEFVLKVRNLISEARKLEQTVKEKISSLGKTNELSPEKKTELVELKEIQGKLREKDITYPQPKLIDQMEYLYYMSNSADQVPGDDAYSQFSNLQSDFEAIRKVIGN